MEPNEKKGGVGSRRRFLRDTSLAATGFFIVPRHVLGRGYIAPSDKLNIAGIGVGGKAEVNLPYAFNNGSDNIVALCDVDDRMAVNGRKKWPKAPYYRDRATDSIFPGGTEDIRIANPSGRNAFSN